MTEKLWDCFRLRCKGQMHDAIRILAEIEDRTISDEARHLIRLGLEQELERLRTVKVRRRDALAIKALFKLLGEDV